MAKNSQTSTNASQSVTNGNGTLNKCTICGKPINPTNTSGIGSTCTKHAGKVGKYYVTAPANIATNSNYVTLVHLCNIAQSVGVSRGYAVRLTGGDAGTHAPVAPVFTVYVLGKRKFVQLQAVGALKVLVTTGKLPAYPATTPTNVNHSVSAVPPPNAKNNVYG